MVANQLRVAIGMAIAAVVVWLAWAGPLHPHIVLPLDNPGSRLAFVAKWLLVPGLALLVGIGTVASRRFFSADAIDGTRAPESRTLEINLRYNQNTLEQAVLVLFAWPLLALLLPATQLGLVPVLAVLFGFGRFAFWIGYLLAPWARAFGFGLTFYPTVTVYIWLAILVLR
ncbi:MAG TPA: MAPEG family protein [Rhizomicrobium sp.]|jgi:hypothetical protein